jgi:hypothetical protein
VEPAARLSGPAVGSARPSSTACAVCARLTSSPFIVGHTQTCSDPQGRAAGCRTHLKPAGGRQHLRRRGRVSGCCAPGWRQQVTVTRLLGRAGSPPVPRQLPCHAVCHCVAVLPHAHTPSSHPGARAVPPHRPSMQLPAERDAGRGRHHRFLHANCGQCAPLWPHCRCQRHQRRKSPRAAPSTATVALACVPTLSDPPSCCRCASHVQVYAMGGK